MHVYYIEQEDLHLIDDPWTVRLKYLAPYQILSYSDKPKVYYEVVLNHTDSMDINHTRESPTDTTNTIFIVNASSRRLLN